MYKYRLIENQNFQLKGGILMVRFTIVDLGGHNRDIPYLVKELRNSNLITATDKDAGGDTIYLTTNLPGVKRIMEDYEGLMLDLIKEK